MSEILKNIETCRGEDVLAEVSALPQDPHFGSLVNEALDPLKQQAAAQEGWDGYSEVIKQHKPYTFASAIIQMKSNLLLLLRALWQYPFGSGTLRSLSDDASLRSLADMWQHYITRLQGNETYGIPSRLSSLTDLPSAPLLLADRKISGVPDAADGISLVHIFCDNTISTPQLLDDNIGWTMNRNIPSTGQAYTKIQVGCGEILNARLYHADSLNTLKELIADEVVTITHNDGKYDQHIINGYTALETISMRKLEHFYMGNRHYLITDCYVEHIYLDSLISMEAYGNLGFVNISGCDELYLPSFEYYRGVNSLVENAFVTGCSFKKIICPKAARFEVNQDTSGNHGKQGIIANCPYLEELELGTLTTLSGTVARDCPRLMTIKIGEGTAINLNMKWWEPDSDVIADADFLSNFRTYIALRLATFVSNGPTLTLSQAVYDAIKDESHLFVFDEGTMTIYAYLTNIKHWTVTK